MFGPSFYLREILTRPRTRLRMPRDKHARSMKGDAYSKDPLAKIFGSGRISQSSSQESLTGLQRTGTIAANKHVEEDTGSLDLFSSQSSSQAGINETIDLTLKLTEYVWVQCDNPDCQKWRRIPAIDADALTDDPWYCHLNMDSTLNYCSAPEEDHAAYDRMAKKAGIKYVMSMLSIGCLVWAKMSGYCRWPAMVTRDPECGLHVMVDEFGDPYSYHVEYLGNPHSHSWVPARSVDVYGHKNLSEIQCSQSQSEKHSVCRGKPGRKRGRGRSRAVTESSAAKLRMSYKRIHIEDVVEEADFFLGLAPEIRLNYSTFKYTPKFEDDNDEVQSENEDSAECEKRKADKPCDKCGHSSQKQAKHHRTKSSSSQHHTQQKRKKKKERKKKPTGKENIGAVESESMSNSLYGKQTFTDEGISVRTLSGTSLAGLESPDQFSQSKLKFQNTMVDKSKEEKFTIDLSMYKRNEKAFEHDVHRFMSRNGQKIKSYPQWQNVPVRLFQLYLAVHERGGFLQVTVRKQWTSVYKELTEHHQAKSGNMAKKYYQRNLYPYELYINGHDYKQAFCQDTKIKPAHDTRERDDTLPQRDARLGPSPTTATTGSDLTLITTRSAVMKGSGDSSSQHLQDSKSDDDDIEAILGRLEQDMQDNSQEYKGSPRRTRKRKGLDIKYLDESASPFTAGKVPSEFQPGSFSDLTGEAQLVPELLGLPDYSSDGDMSNMGNKILHEMKALQKDMKEITGDLDL